MQAGAVSINARFRRSPQSGVQRVAVEILERLGLPHREIIPPEGTTGLRGHAWEQIVLPLRARGEPLWSPCNTGPLAVRSQVVTIHDAAVFDHPEWFSRQFVASYRFLLPRLARSARRVVTVSRFSRGRLAATLGVHEDGIDIVCNGVSDRFGPASATATADAAASYGVTPGRYFVTLSTLEPRKNLRTTIDAWEIARARLPGDMRLLLLGGAGAGRIFAGGDLPDAVGGIVRAGFVPDGDLPALLSGAVGLLYPSLYEGFGLPVLEAMACGTPVVTSSTTSLPEVGGDAALYVEPTDTRALADAMHRIATSTLLQSELRDAGIARARGFSWESSAARMRHILGRDLGLS